MNHRTAGITICAFVLSTVAVGCGSTGGASHATAPSTAAVAAVPVTATVAVVTVPPATKQVHYNTGSPFDDQCTLIFTPGRPTEAITFGAYGTVWSMNCPTAAGEYISTVGRAGPDVKIPKERMFAGQAVHVVGSVEGYSGDNVNISSTRSLVVNVTSVT